MCHLIILHSFLLYACTRLLSTSVSYLACWLLSFKSSTLIDSEQNRQNNGCTRNPLWHRGDVQLANILLWWQLFIPLTQVVTIAISSDVLVKLSCLWQFSKTFITLEGILWSSSLKLSCLVIVRAMFSKKASCRSLFTRVTQLNGLALQIFPSLSYQIKL